MRRCLATRPGPRNRKRGGSPLAAGVAPGDDSALRSFGVGQMNVPLIVDDVTTWPSGARHPSMGRPYLSCAYVPMIELLRYLEANGFSTYIASGGNRDFMRPFAEELYGIPPERVIGSALGLDLQLDDDGTDLPDKSKIKFFDDGPEKPVRIWGLLRRRSHLHQHLFQRHLVGPHERSCVGNRCQRAKELVDHPARGGRQVTTQDQ